MSKHKTDLKYKDFSDYYDEYKKKKSKAGSLINKHTTLRLVT